MTQGLISIIIPVYNSEKFIGEAIQSVINQSYENWELIVVNDGSTDGSELEILKFDDTRIRYHSKVNGGVSCARNLGLQKMSGQYVCFLDADDVLTTNSLSSRMDLFLADEDLTFVDGAVRVMDETLSETIETRQHRFIGDPLSALLRIDNNCFFGITWMIRLKSDYQYQFHKDLTHGEDLMFYIDISKNGGFYKATEELIYIRRTRDSSAMKNLDGLWIGYKNIYHIINEDPDINKELKSTFKKRIFSIMFKSYLGNGFPLKSVKVIFEYFSI